MAKRRSFKLTLKPASDGCNLACKHCFVAGEPSKIEIMTPKTLYKVFERASDYAHDIRVSWHGGEPMLAGLDLWKRAMDIQAHLPSDFRNNVQTNLTLLNQDWVDFFKANRIQVGTSIDGIRDIHDSYRTYMDGRGSFDQVYDGIELLKANGIGENIGAIACYTKYMVGRMMEVYDAFKEMGISWKINPMIKSGRGDEVTDDIGVEPITFADEFCDMIDRYLFDDDAPVMQSIDYYVEQLIDGAYRENNDITVRGSCQNGEVAVDAKGDCYPCGRFTQKGESLLGNLHDVPFNDIFSAQFKKMMINRDYTQMEGCSDCEYGKACMGGCAHDAWLYNDGDMSERDHMCAGNKRIYGHIVEVVTKLKNEVKQ